MSENTTIARPYAEAVFNAAIEASELDVWSDMLAFIAAVMADVRMSGLAANPRVESAKVADLVLDIAGDRLTHKGANMVRLLAQNGRLGVVAEIAELFEAKRSAHAGAIDVEVTAAFPVDAAQEQKLAEVLKSKLGREVRISSVQDQSLIGGVIIRAGDSVIDGSVRGQLQDLANSIGA
jgi:F-type H+-transporting ATPase subunit delta